MRINVTRNFIKIALFLFFVSIYQSFSIVSQAQVGGVAPGETVQTNPKTRDNTVTASVPDIVPPSVPFLIAPEDEALINDSTPSFVWQQSTDNVGVDYYELYIDGILEFGSIPTSSTSNGEYTLTYDSNAGTYTLVPVSPLSDGSHSWYVMVYDAAGNNNTSVTWDFTIDTNAPNFVIQTIGPLSTTISAQDIGSVPEETIELEDNEPEFTGTGEANATVQVTVQIPGESNQIINFTVGGDGNWNFQLGILPRDEIITLNFVITDEAGNISVITDLKILIIQEYIIIPPTPTPTATPSITPTPEPSPEATTSATPTPTASPAPTPIIKIPILPPEEIAEIIKDQITEIIPEPIQVIAALIPQEIRQAIQLTTDAIAPIGVLVATAAIPTFSLFALLLQFGQQFSWDILLKILQALGLLPPQEPQGMVFDSQTNEPVPFALLTIISTNEVGEKIIETAVTDVDGIYQGIQLPVGTYQIQVAQQDYTFPTSKQRPGYFTIQEFYKGEEFEVNSNRNQQLFLIPMDRKTEIKHKSSIGKTVRGVVRKLRHTDLFWPLFLISILITLFYPTWINYLMFGFYCLLLLKRFIKSFEKPAISGFVTTATNDPVQNAIIRISDPTKGELVSIVNTNKLGYHQSFLDPNKYQIQITKSGLIWERKESQLSFEEVDVTKERKTVDAVMRDITDIYKELFGELPK